MSSTGWGKIVKKSLGQMGFNMSGGPVNWFPGHMASATRAIRDRLKLADLVIEVRDSRIPISSINGDLQDVLSSKRRVIALNKKDLANPNIMNKWSQYFDNLNQDCISINAHSKSSVKKLLELVELKLKEVIAREPTLLVMVVGVPNVGKSSLINSIHQIASSRFPAQDRTKRATVGPLPGVTQDIAGFKIAHQPSIYVLDTPGILVPSIPDIETGLKLALTGSVKDSVVGEERLAQYLLAVLNYRSTPLHWKHLNNRRTESLNNEAKTKEDRVREFMLKGRKKLNESDLRYIEDLVGEVQCALYMTLSEFDGNLEDENDLESLIETQFTALQKALKISSHKASDEARTMVSKKFLTLFRIGKLGPFTLDDVPEGTDVLVHRGIYEAAKGIYEQFMPEILSHLATYGDRAKLRFTGHSPGGSLSLLVNLMLLARGVVKPSSLLPVVTFGSPSIFCGGHRNLDELGVDESHVHSVMIHRDIVPRAFSCNYPNHVAQVLKRLNGTFRSHPCLNNNKMLYTPLGVSCSFCNQMRSPLLHTLYSHLEQPCIHWTRLNVIAPKCP